MARINNRKYDYLAREFANLLIETDRHVGPTYYADNFGSAIALVQDSHHHIQHQKCRELAQEILSYDSYELFDKHPAFEAPTYYGYGNRDDVSIRGVSRQQAFKSISNNIDISFYYWQSLGADEYGNHIARQSFVRSISEHIKYDNAPKDLMLLQDPMTRADKDCDWGDETIMTASEWARLEEFMDQNDIYPEEHSNLVWHDAGGFDVATLINLIQQLDEEHHNRWSGSEAGDDECILGRLEALNQEQPILALAVAQRIDSIIFNTKLSWGQRYTACERALARAEEAAE